MPQIGSLSVVEEIMLEFAKQTGLTDTRKDPRRYLWTDAFAVCNFLELHRQTGDNSYMDLALRLVGQVHNILGRHRVDDPRTGWISGLGEEEGRNHPTSGGLRIGKELNERKPSEPINESEEWDRDGQYYHYLTKWMHALNQVSQKTGDPIYNVWAIELAKTAHSSFTYVPPPGGKKRMYWKMSIDLSYPLVPSMGHHDPLDGFITYNQIQATSDKNPGTSKLDINPEITDMADICKGKQWATNDPLGIGGLLSDACRLTQLVANESLEQANLLEELLFNSLIGIEYITINTSLKLPADYRLAFRELGLVIGIKGVDRIEGMINKNPDRFTRKDRLTLRIDALKSFGSLSNTILEFWLDPAHQKSSSWKEHSDINMVMLATCLAPDGFLLL